MKNAVLVIFILLSVSCTSGPEPIIIGKDICSSCKMIFSDIRFGGEIVTKKGKVYKFDDVNCMLNFLDNEINKKENPKDLLVLDYTGNNKLIGVYKSYFLVDKNIRSPMNSGIAAFESKEQANSLLTNFSGSLFQWNELIDFHKSK
jgi:copper chaperone NosL